MKDGIRGKIAALFMVILILVDGFGGVYISGLSSGNPFYLVTSYQQADGIVTAIRSKTVKKHRNGTKSNYNKSSTYYVTRRNAEVEYTIGSGDSEEKHTVTLTSVGDRYSKGSALTVCYDPANPDKAIAKDDWQTIFNILIVCVILNLGVVIGIIIFILRIIKPSGRLRGYGSNDLESRFKPYDEYDGGLTERAKEILGENTDTKP